MSQIVTLLNDIRSALLVDATLAGYLDTIAIQDYNEAELPDFDTYCIILSPAPTLLQRDFVSIVNFQDRLQIQAICLLDKWNTHNTSLTSVAAESPGILQFVEDVRTALHLLDLSSDYEITGLEQAGPVAFGSISKTYYRAVLPLAILLPEVEED